LDNQESGAGRRQVHLVSESRSINVLGSACCQGNPTGDHMTTVMGHEKCKQCGFEFGHQEFSSNTDEWNFDCRICGYGESLKWIATEDGSRVGWKHDTLDGHGAVCATRSGGMHPITFYGLRSTQDVDEAARNIQEGIAKGELDAESSYVT
jgi:hypothetical protein